MRMDPFGSSNRLFALSISALVLLSSCGYGASESRGSSCDPPFVWDMELEECVLEGDDDVGEPCGAIHCGANAYCIEDTCVCEPGYEGDPNVGCQLPDACQGVTCGTNAYCSGGMCVCQPGYEGDPNVGCQLPDVCQGVTCGTNAYCSGGMCVCQPGYEGDPNVGCQLPDACQGVTCGTNAYCSGGACVCQPGYEGNPNVACQPLDPCAGVTCGGHATCQNGVCVCQNGYVGDPYVGCAPAATGRRVLFFGAHPDDELVFAPWLGEECVDKGGVCRFVVATRGEGGTCSKPEGCHPDLGTVRVQEMLASAAIFGASVVQGGFANYSASVTFDHVLSQWSATAGGQDPLIDAVVAEMTSFQPDLVLTFDPRHGVTCHPEHRVLGQLVLWARHRMGSSAPETWVASHLVATDGLTYTGFQNAVPSDSLVFSYDAKKHLGSVQGQAWRYMSLVIAEHKSQQGGFLTMQAVEAAPSNLRMIYFLDMDAGEQALNPAYDTLCP